MKHLYLKKGFTLIEMIIAVGLLAVAGVAIASLFVFSHVNNQKATNMDKSVALLSGMIEEIKASPEPWLAGDPQNPDGTLVTVDTGFYVVYYNKDWQPLKASSEDGTPNEAEYTIMINFYEVPSNTGLISLDVRSVKLKPYALTEEANTEIFMLTTRVKSATVEVIP